MSDTFGFVRKKYLTETNRGRWVFLYCKKNVTEPKSGFIYIFRRYRYYGNLELLKETKSVI